MSKIEWTDATWGPVTGCTAVSEGCRNCYAATMTRRLAGMAIADAAKGKDPGHKANYLHVLNERGKWNGKVRCHEDVLDKPLHWRKPRMIFVNSMSDLFHRDVPVEFIDRVFAVMALCPQHTFQILTKRPERMAEYLTTERAYKFEGNWPSRGFIESEVDGMFASCWGDHLRRLGTVAPIYTWPLPNVWLGTSVENQVTLYRLDHLRKCPAALLFVSCEPLLGAIDLLPYLISFRCCECRHESISAKYRQGYSRACSACGSNASGNQVFGPAIDWVIVGGESGPGARPCDVAWIRSIRDQCKAADVPAFVKQLGAKPRSGDWATGHSVIEGDRAFLDGNESFVIRHPKGGDMSEWPKDLRVREMPEVSHAE